MEELKQDLLELELGATYTAKELAKYFNISDNNNYLDIRIRSKLLEEFYKFKSSYPKENRAGIYIITGTPNPLEKAYTYIHKFFNTRKPTTDRVFCLIIYLYLSPESARNFESFPAMTDDFNSRYGYNISRRTFTTWYHRLLEKVTPADKIELKKVVEAGLAYKKKYFEETGKILSPLHEND